MSLRNISIRKMPDSTHVLCVDDRKINTGSIESASFTFDKGSIPRADIIFAGVPDIAEDMDLTVTLDPKCTRDCIKYLALQLQLDDAFREAWIASISSALEDLDKLADAGSEPDNFNKARYILDRIIE